MLNCNFSFLDVNLMIIVTVVVGCIEPVWIIEVGGSSRVFVQDL